MPTTPSDILTRLRAANPAEVSPERANDPAARAALERILNDRGAEAASRGPRRPYPRLRRWLRAAPVLAAALVALAVVGGALVLLGRGHGPASGSRPPGEGIRALIAHTPRRQLQRELGYVFAAMGPVQSSKACRSHQPSGVTYIEGSPGRDLLSILGVLRRPATPADRFNPARLGQAPNVYRAYIRRAFAAGGVSAYIVPARFDPAAAGIPSDRCLALETAAFNRYLPRIPARLRRPTRQIEAAIIAYFRTIASQSPRDTVCLVSVAGSQTGSSCGITSKGIEAGFATENSLGTPLDTFSGIVPDGVAAVTLLFPGRAPPHAVTTRVEGNVYAVHFSLDAVPLSRSSPSPSPTVIWRSPQGRVLKRMSTSPAAERAYICKQSPVPCLLAVALQSGGSSSISSSSHARSAPVRAHGG